MDSEKTLEIFQTVDSHLEKQAGNNAETEERPIMNSAASMHLSEEDDPAMCMTKPLKLSSQSWY